MEHLEEVVHNCEAKVKAHTEDAKVYTSVVGCKLAVVDMETMVDTHSLDHDHMKKTTIYLIYSSNC